MKTLCGPRSRYYRKSLPHLYTSRKRTQSAGEWSAWAVQCSWCGKAEP